MADIEQSTKHKQSSLLKVRDLSTTFSYSGKVARAVDTVNLTVSQGETLAVVGESGCGKTVLALSIMGLVPNPPGKISTGSIVFQNRDLLTLSAKELCCIRGNDLAMIFQEPMSSLNPVFTVGEQIAESLRKHRKLPAKKAHVLAINMLKTVGIPDPKLRATSYPHELSGGMRQRVMIAMALCCEPKLLLADEPTTALDLTVQAQILELLEQMRQKNNAAQILITHDLGVVARMSHRALVMYAGQVVEEALVHDLLTTPLHPYTAGLLASLPSPQSRQALTPIPGTVPSIFALPQGCRFAPRCTQAHKKCSEIPPLFDYGDRKIRCWLHETGSTE